MTEKKITISDYYYKKTEIDNLLNSKEDKSNKVTSLSLNSTDDEYPTAKAVYDDVTNKYNALSDGLTNGLNSLSSDLNSQVTSLSSNLNSQVTSIWDTLGPLPSTKEDKSNKVTSLSSESTDDQYPSAKAVYTTTNNIANGFSSQVSSIWNTLGPISSNTITLTATLEDGTTRTYTVYGRQK